MAVHVFEVDLSGHLDPEGRITGEGLELLLARLREMFRSRFPFTPGEVIDRTVSEITRDVAGQKPADIKIRVTAGTVKGQCERARRGLDGAQEGLLHLAQLLDTEKSVSGPHVFLCGEASAKVEIARDLLAEVASMVEAMLQCKECFGGERETHEPPN